MAQAYSAADVFALPSIQDNLPNTMLESMCCGTPVVAFNSGGTAEIIRDGINGLIAPEKTPQSLSKALATALDLRWERSAISRNAREMFEPGRQARAYLEVYSKMLS
jgi:glycosyltransferase involved in cell wall biosynthesis